MAHRYDLVIVGMGSGGMTAAEFAATIGLKVAVIERGRVGGDCLWTGCVPSKALLASAKAAHVMRTADRFGLEPVQSPIDTTRVWARIRAIQADIASTDDDPDRYRAMGIEVIEGEAMVTGAHEVTVDGVRRLDTRFVLICTGSRPAQPAIPGLAEAGFLTSETVFELERAPASIVMIGGGPIAVELAQAFTRLGVTTTVLQKGPTILPRDEPELVAVLHETLRRDGVDIRCNVEIENVTVAGGKKVVHGRLSGESRTWTGDELLVAVGRVPTLAGLGLDELGVAIGPRGVVVDDRGRSSIDSIYVAGDVAGRLLFTHSAAYEAVRAVRDAFFPGKGKVDTVIPWCTFTDPELAHAGLTTAEAHARYGDGVDVRRLESAHSDRARTESATEGAIVVVTAKGRVVGAHILATAAGEVIHELALAVSRKMRLTDLAGIMHVYPTMSTGIGQLAAQSAFEKARRLRWLVRKGR
jgi:pyruvate/2-oxoglutarate dehydrogenase complex dihydrolipoamide dehydrogenase (E3) component